MTGIGVVRRFIEAAWERVFGCDIFITYTRRDGEAYARALQRALEREYLVFLDDGSIHGGQSIPERIRREIRRCRLHLIVLTPEAADRERAPWIFTEVELHLRERRRHALQTIFFPPHSPRSLPAGLERLADYKGVTELPGAEREGSVSIRVLAAIAGRESPATVDALWAESERRASVVAEIRRGFSAVRQRTRIQQAAVIALCLLLSAGGGSGWASYAARRRLVLAQEAEQAEAGLHFLDAERAWLAAARVAPWSRAEFREKWARASERRLLTPTAVVTLPAGWRAHAIGSRGGEWCLLVHRMHDRDAANGRAALIDSGGWRETVGTGDDFNPRVLFHANATFIHAAGKITRLPGDGSARSEVDLGLTSYRLASFPPQVELGWKADRLCVLASLEHPPRVFLLDPATLQIESNTELKLPIDLPTPSTEPDGSDRFGEAVFRLSTRDDSLVVAAWRRFTEYKVGVVKWGRDFQPKPAAREFLLPMTDIGPVTSPDLETVELAPGDQQLFLRITTINFSGSTPKRAGQIFWLALDTASNRPAFLLESMISEVWPLPAHQSLEAYYRVDGGDLRALTFPDFVVTTRPPVGVLRDVRAASLLSIPQSDTLTLAAVMSREITLVREGKPIFRIAAPPAVSKSDARLDHAYADLAGHWLAAAFEVNSDDTPQRLLIWKTGTPASSNSLPTSVDFTHATLPAEFLLTSEPPP